MGALKSNQGNLLKSVQANFAAEVSYDASRIRMHQLPQIFAVARHFVLNLYRPNEFPSMAQAERLCKFGLDPLKSIFRMK